MMAPAVTPPITPAPTQQPKQRACAGAGTLRVATLTWLPPQSQGQTSSLVIHLRRARRSSDLSPAISSGCEYESNAILNIPADRKQVQDRNIESCRYDFIKKGALEIYVEFMRGLDYTLVATLNVL
jgi:hypothetical protein